MTGGPWDLPPPDAPAQPALPIGMFCDGRTAALREVTLVLIEDSPASLLMREVATPVARSEGTSPADAAGQAAFSMEWPLAQLRRLPDQAGNSDPDDIGHHPTLVLTCTSAPLARLVVHHRGAIATILARAPALDARLPLRGKGRIAAWACAAVAAVALIIFGLVPLMANQLAAFLPPEGEKALGDKTYAQIRTAFGDEFFPLPECSDPAGLAAFQSMTERLVAQAEVPLDITFTVLDSDIVNAFALPGGRIVVFSGLIYESESADEVAAVIAHEIGHVVHRDPTRAALRTAGSFGVLGLLFGDFAGGSVVLMLANQVVEARYSQEAEAQADAFAHALLPKVGVSPAELAKLFEYLRDEYGEDSGIVKHFSSHPELGDRIAQARAAQAANPVPIQPLLSPSQEDAFFGICDEYGADDMPGGAFLRRIDDFFDED
ncbi:Metalloprotease LoiP precursor [Aquimixticola soesokkakensis]|uniref:Metalloprotease LoiP n=1 Tax=Aquimixticola soesokkakensis TaxID=1519096 RepID=A0A1Y5RJ91_9RHOB|nr:M48 family metallopeptidase [Aquimixticola soesokkakensis]SLN18881.1 Metalloprotease LoiP precursor [Aquimixticola soesokkakensis]